VSPRVAIGSRPLANGLGIDPSEAETFRTEFLRSLRARGLGGVGLVISDAHTGLRAAIARVFEATWQRCRAGLLKNAQPPDSIRLRQDRVGVSDAGASISGAAGVLPVRVFA
jgi:hypothetical protein